MHCSFLSINSDVLNTFHFMVQYSEIYVKNYEVKIDTITHSEVSSYPQRDIIFWICDMFENYEYFQFDNARNKNSIIFACTDRWCQSVTIAVIIGQNIQIPSNVFIAQNREMQVINLECILYIGNCRNRFVTTYMVTNWLINAYSIMSCTFLDVFVEFNMCRYDLYGQFLTLCSYTHFIYVWYMTISLDDDLLYIYPILMLPSLFIARYKAS